MTRVTVVLLLALSTQVASAQGEISGRVLTADSSRSPLPGVEASLPRLRLTATSESSGRFRLKEIPPGSYLLVMRAVGFRAESSTVSINRDETVSWEVRMTRADATMLPERVVTAPEAAVPAKLLEFTERRKMGVGHFLDRSQLEKAEGGVRTTGDLLSIVPGVRVRRGGSKAWVTTFRAVNQVGTCAFCPPARLSKADLEAGARGACYMDVYIDGALVFDSRLPESGLFDINTVPPDHIAGIEVYTSAAQIPAKYNRTAAGCGVLLIWTR